METVRNSQALDSQTTLNGEILSNSQVLNSQPRLNNWTSRNSQSENSQTSSNKWAYRDIRAVNIQSSPWMFRESQALDTLTSPGSLATGSSNNSEWHWQPNLGSLNGANFWTNIASSTLSREDKLTGSESFTDAGITFTQQPNVIQRSDSNLNSSQLYNTNSKVTSIKL
jgi:hypothetical protein